MKSKLLLIARFLALAILYFICFSFISALILPRLQQGTTNNEPISTLAGLLTVCFLNTAVLMFVVIHSQWRRWKLVAAMGFVLFGVTTLMTQIETAVFVQNLPPGFLPRLVLSGFLFSFIYAFLLVLVLGKFRRDPTIKARGRVRIPVIGWILKLGIISVIYVVFYFTFGYFIAWQNPALRAYYGGSDPGSFAHQISQVWRDTPLLFPLQILRALLWTALAFPVIRMIKGKLWKAGFAVALLFSVVMNSQLLLPNPLMPFDVRMSHLLETATSNFIFGWIIVGLLGDINDDTERS